MKYPNTKTGRIGRATSRDGLVWKKTDGPEEQGSVLDVNQDAWWGFDTSHVGLGDVTFTAAPNPQGLGDIGAYFMYFFGGDNADDHPEAMGMRGHTLKIGVAVSQDGYHWSRVEGEHPSGAVIDLEEEGSLDRALVAWPQVLNHQSQEFRMYYGTLDQETKTICMALATSNDGVSWKKKGVVMTAGPPGSFDERGVSRRHVVERVTGIGYDMVYEGIDAEGKHAIGWATSEDGIVWKVGRLVGR